MRRSASSSPTAAALSCTCADTWAIHRPGWYTQCYHEMRRPEGPVLLAGSDLAAGWAGFIDGAIESGLTAGRWLRGQGR